MLWPLCFWWNTLPSLTVTASRSSRSWQSLTNCRGLHICFTSQFNYHMRGNRGESHSYGSLLWGPFMAPLWDSMLAYVLQGARELNGEVWLNYWRLPGEITTYKNSQKSSTNLQRMCSTCYQWKFYDEFVVLRGKNNLHSFCKILWLQFNVSNAPIVWCFIERRSNKEKVECFERLLRFSTVNLFHKTG